MRSDSVEAYDFPERVRTYDADMDVMHPLRSKMLEVAMEVLPFDRERSLTALDLGVGTGVFTQRFLETFPNSRVVAVDGAASMVRLATARLGALARRVEWQVADFNALPASLTEPQSYDVVFSAYALHHLSGADKLILLSSVVRAMRPGGWLLNADLVVAGDSAMERRIQQLRVEGIIERAAAGDQRFATTESTRRFLDDLEAAERDQPVTLDEDLRILRQAGIVDAEVFWKQYREVVYGGPMSEGSPAAAARPAL